MKIVKMENVTVTDVHFAPPPAPKYRVFEGRRRPDAEQEIVDADMRLASIQDLMQFRLDALESGFEPAINQAWNNWYDSNTWIAYWAGKVKIGEGFLMSKNPQLQNRGLVLTEAQFDNLTGVTFTRLDLEKAGVDKPLTQTQASIHPVWKTVGGSVLERYVPVEFQRYDLIGAMGVYLAPELAVPTQRPLVLAGGNGWSDLIAGRNLNFSARLVGVRKGALEERVAK